MNGQFAFAIYDRKKKLLFLARDHFGINPLYYTVAGGVFIFASEIKAILEHPLVEREVDLTGLDQTFSFPGLVSPRTMFKGIHSLKSGHYLLVQNGDVQVREYWDLDYPRDGEIAYDRPESYYVERLDELLTRSVNYRLQADVPVGFYLSGGLDSSMIAALINKVSPGSHRHSFSIDFNDRHISESKYQQLMARYVDSVPTDRDSRRVATCVCRSNRARGAGLASAGCRKSHQAVKRCSSSARAAAWEAGNESSCSKRRSSSRPSR